MANPSPSNDWFVCPQANARARLRLFLFPYAGGGPPVFNKWMAGFPASIETWIAHYPGRGSRHAEPLLEQIPSLATGLSEAMQGFVERPFAFFGHSLGGLAAFEVARALRRQALPQPEILFVSGCGAPHLADPHAPIHGLPDPEFLHALQDLHGIPDEVVQQPELLRLLLPILRADFQAMESYIYTPESPLSCRLLALGGCDDQRLSRTCVEAWRLQTTSAFEAKYFPGDHFFIHTAREEVIASLSAELSIDE